MSRGSWWPRMAMVVGLIVSGTACDSGDGQTASGSGSASVAGAGECSPVGTELEEAADETVAVELDEYAFNPAIIEVAAGTVTFEAENIGPKTTNWPSCPVAARCQSPTAPPMRTPWLKPERSSWRRSAQARPATPPTSWSLAATRCSASWRPPTARPTLRWACRVSYACNIRRRIHRSLVELAPLWVDRLAASEHGHELLDATGPGVGALGAFDPVQDRVTVLAREDVKHRLCPRFCG